MIIVDVETGGLDPRENPLLSIGAIDYSSQTSLYLKCHPYPALNVTEEALAINGINIEEWNKNPALAETILQFKSWLFQFGEKIMLAGHNPRFDLDFLNESARIAGIKLPFGYRTVDLHSIAYYCFKKKGMDYEDLKADTIYTKLGMETEPKPHNALVGAQYEREAFHRLFTKF